jgi:diaminopimelate epimerase
MIAFTKMEGCGNDFILIEDKDERLGDLSALGRALCERTTGIGADGLIVLRQGVKPAAYSVVIINRLGLPAEMCGNGARCVARYATLHGLAPAKHQFQTVAGLISAELDGDQVRIGLSPPSEAALDQRLEIDGHSWTLDVIDTGVPHAVVWTEQPLDQIDVPRLGSALRHHPFFPKGANINFVAREEGQLRIRTFERGVEAETQACGTGASAAALLAQTRGYAASPVRVRTRHGGVLTIDIGRGRDGPATVHLTGPARVVFAGHLDESWQPS